MSFLPFLLLQIVIFAGLVAVLRKVLSRSATDTAAHLEGLSAEYSRRQEELKKRLEESERQYNEQVGKGKEESQRLVVEAKQEASNLKAKALADAREESERIVHQGVETRDALRRDIEREINAKALERANDLIQRALPLSLREELQTHWFDELFRDGLAKQFERLGGEHVSEVKVVSALPLTKEQSAMLRAKLKERLGKEATVIEETDDRLVAGVVVTVGSLVFDGSLATKVQDAMRKAHDAAN
jgi:F0F1-type ATP synthase membrane subunit b/b'